MIIIVINVRKTEESQLSVLLRLLTNYLQLISTSLTMNSSYPETFANIFIPAKRIGSSSESFLSFDCFIRNSEIKGPFDSNSFFKLFLLALLPLFIFMVVTLIWVILYLVNHKYVKDMQRNLIISFISILFILHPKLTEQSIQSFRCIEIDKGVQMARMDLEISCYSWKHLKW